VNHYKSLLLTFLHAACLLCLLRLQTVDVYLLRAGSTSSLVHTMGISSSAIPLMFAPNNLLASNLLNRQSLNYWNLWDYKQALLSFVDGGVWESAAVQRHAAATIALVSSSAASARSKCSDYLFLYCRQRCCWADSCQPEECSACAEADDVLSQQIAVLHCQLGCLSFSLGAVDDLAVMPLLRRGVKNIVVCLATYSNPNATIKEFAERKLTHQCSAHQAGRLHAAKRACIRSCNEAVPTGSCNMHACI
jgi:hypothetical protein